MIEPFIINDPEGDGLYLELTVNCPTELFIGVGKDEEAGHTVRWVGECMGVRNEDVPAMIEWLQNYCEEVKK